MLELKLHQLEHRKIYENTDLKLEQGITILIGKNGAGKSYMMSQIKSKYEHALDIDIVDETKKNILNGGNILNDIKAFSKYINASEGQRVYDNLENLTTDIGKYVSECKRKNQSVIILLDGVDSGVSPDLINIIRYFLNLVDKDCQDDNIERYIIVSANNYELVHDYKALWVTNLKEYNFNLENKEDYYNFRNLYLDDTSDLSE